MKRHSSAFLVAILTLGGTAISARAQGPCGSNAGLNLQRFIQHRVLGIAEGGACQTLPCCAPPALRIQQAPLVQRCSVGDKGPSVQKSSLVQKPFMVQEPAMVQKPAMVQEPSIVQKPAMVQKAAVGRRASCGTWHCEPCGYCRPSRLAEMVQRLDTALLRVFPPRVGCRAEAFEVDCGCEPPSWSDEVLLPVPRPLSKEPLLEDNPFRDDTLEEPPPSRAAARESDLRLTAPANRMAAADEQQAVRPAAYWQEPVITSIAP